MKMRDKIKADIAEQKAKKGVIMRIPIKDLNDLEGTIADEINVNHHEFPGGCNMKIDKASSNIVDLFTQFLEKHSIELVK